jgi:arsenate reductase-like glutaredoxin family protein
MDDMINNEVGELTLIFNSDKHDDQKARGYAEALQGFKVKTLDISREKITETQLAEIANMMNVQIEDLIDPTYDDHISVHKEGLNMMDRQSMLTLMVHDTKLIATPIAIIGKHAYKFGTGYEFLKEKMVQEVAGLRSANREEKRGIHRAENPGEKG